MSLRKQNWVSLSIYTKPSLFFHWAALWARGRPSLGKVTLEAKYRHLWRAEQVCRTVGAEKAWSLGGARWKWGPTSRWGLDRVTVADSLRTWHCELWGVTEGVWTGGNVDLEDVNWMKWRIHPRERNKRHRGGYSNSRILIVNTSGH